MKANEQAETFIDRYSSSFEEYLSSVVNKLRDTDSEYKDIEERIAKLYEDYPRVKDVFDLEQAAALFELDCKALLEVLTLRNRLFDKQQEAIYLRGCYDNIRYLNTVYKLIKEGHFKAAFIGGKWRISKLSFDLWLDGKE